MQPLQAADCWKFCGLDFGFNKVTWYLVDSPDAPIPQDVARALGEVEKKPWEDRYCAEAAYAKMKGKKRTQMTKYAKIKKERRARNSTKRV